MAVTAVAAVAAVVVAHTAVVRGAVGLAAAEAVDAIRLNRRNVKPPRSIHASVKCTQIPISEMTVCATDRPTDPPQSTDCDFDIC